MTFSAERAEMQQAFRDPPHLNPSLPGIGQNYALLSAPIALALGAMKKNLAAEVATLSGGEASGFANRGELEADLGTLAKSIRSRYLLSFRPTSKAPGMHALAVRVVGIRSWWWRLGVVIWQWRATRVNELSYRCTRTKIQFGNAATHHALRVRVIGAEDQTTYIAPAPMSTFEQMCSCFGKIVGHDC